MEEAKRDVVVNVDATEKVDDFEADGARHGKRKMVGVEVISMN